MCADRVPPTPTVAGDPVATDDLTLSGADDAELRAAGFPDTVQDAHLVLYQSADGGVELRWHLDATALAHARGAFGEDHDAPSPVLRLRQMGGEEGCGGASRVIADAALEEWHMVAEGIARCSAGAATGLLQAEIGLSTAAGGWVLVARSNRLQAIGPVGAPFLRASEHPAMTAAAEMESAREPEPAPIAPPSAKPQSLKPLGRLIPEFPLVQPPPRAAREPGSAMSLDSLPVPGSGPVQPFSGGAASEINAELLVHGSTAPGTLLDLGGHPYRVGAGGRFAFRIPLHDQDLIVHLLAGVPGLPVESRVGDGEPGEQGD